MAKHNGRYVKGRWEPGEAEKRLRDLEGQLREHIKDDNVAVKLLNAMSDASIDYKVEGQDRMLELAGKAVGVTFQYDGEEVSVIEGGDLASRLSQLEQEFRDYRESLAKEVCTRRLSIIDHDGFERIIGETTESEGRLVVRARPHNGSEHHMTSVSMWATEEDAEAAAFDVSVRGNGGAHLGATVQHDVHHPEDERASVRLMIERLDRDGEGLPGPNGLDIDGDGVKVWAPVG